MNIILKCYILGKLSNMHVSRFVVQQTAYTLPW